MQCRTIRSTKETSDFGNCPILLTASTWCSVERITNCQRCIAKGRAMRQKKTPNGLRANIVRLLAALALSSTAISAHAESCWDLYPKSGATPGTSSCRLDVASNTPSGIGSSGCRNDMALIDAWCSTPSDPDDSCPVADPVYPANGKVTLMESDFRSGDAVPLTFTRSYLSSPFVKSATAMGPMWLNNWQRQLNLTGASGSSPKVIAYRASG
jgi:hypothetical protein